MAPLPPPLPSISGTPPEKIVPRVRCRCHGGVLDDFLLFRRTPREQPHKDEVMMPCTKHYILSLPATTPMTPSNSTLPLTFPRNELFPRHSHGVARELLASTASNNQPRDRIDSLARSEFFPEWIIEWHRQPRHARMILLHGALVAVEADEYDLERLMLRLRPAVERGKLRGVLAAGPVLARSKRIAGEELEVG